jgi:hypothetical protein
VEFARARVEGANIAGRRWKSFGIAAADDEKIFIDDGGAGERDEGGGVVAAEMFAEIDAAVLAERWDRFAGRGIKRVNEVHDADENALVSIVGPERETTVGLCAGNSGIEFPKKRAGRGIECENFLGRRNSIKGAIDDIGLVCNRRVLACRKTGNFELSDIGAIDLRERRSER